MDFVAGVGSEFDSESDKESELDPECGQYQSSTRTQTSEPDPERGSDLGWNRRLEQEREPELNQRGHLSWSQSCLEWSYSKSQRHHFFIVC